MGQRGTGQAQDKAERDKYGATRDATRKGQRRTGQAWTVQLS